MNKLPRKIVCAAAMLWTSTLFVGCSKDDWCNCLSSTGAKTTEFRPLTDFFAVEMDNNIDVVFNRGSGYGAYVTCGKNLMDGIKTEVRNGVLFISNENKCNWLRDFKNSFEVEINYMELTNITNRGSGNIICADTIKTPMLQVDSWNGTGIMNFIINCNEARFKLHTGPADIIASGNAGVFYIYTAGNGYVKAAAVNSNYTYVTTKSTGDCEVSALMELGVDIEYHGDVYYKGSPASITTNITGSGQLLPL